jgi:hypothetical protein
MSKIICEKTKNILSLLRTLLEDNPRLCSSIDESYQKVLISQLNLIPDSATEELIDVIYLFEIALKYFNFRGFLGEIKNKTLSLNYNIREFINSKVKQSDMLSKDVKSQMLNIVKKFEPVILCCEELLKHPAKYLKRYVDRDQNDILRK